MLKINYNTEKSESGFTLVELLVAILISTVVALTVVRVMSTSANVISKSADSAVAAQQAVRLASVITYDAAGASSVKLYGSSAPTGESQCWSKSVGGDLPQDKSNSANSWGWSPNLTTTDSSVIRSVALFAIKSAYSNTFIADNTWRSTTDKFVGYEIRRNFGGYSKPFELWRTECQGALGTLTSRPEKIATLGYENSSLMAGTSIFRCPGLNVVTAPVSPINSSNVYTFTVASNQSISLNDVVEVFSSTDYSKSIRGTVTLINSGSIQVTATSSPGTLLGTSSWIFTKDCPESTNLFGSNQFILLDLPYSGKRVALSSQAPLVLRSRVAK